MDPVGAGFVIGIIVGATGGGISIGFCWCRRCNGFHGGALLFIGGGLGGCNAFAVAEVVSVVAHGFWYGVSKCLPVRHQRLSRHCVTVLTVALCLCLWMAHTVHLLQDLLLLRLYLALHYLLELKY